MKNSKNKKYINLQPNPSNAMLTEIEALESCLIDDIFGQVFKETIGIPIGTNCHSHCRYFSLLPWDIGSANTYQDNTHKKTTEANAFNLTFVYIDDVLLIDNPSFANFAYHYTMCTI